MGVGAPHLCAVYDCSHPEIQCFAGIGNPTFAAGMAPPSYNAAAAQQPPPGTRLEPSDVDPCERRRVHQLRHVCNLQGTEGINVD
jgi:hypothetical protein